MFKYNLEVLLSTLSTALYLIKETMYFLLHHDYMTTSASKLYEELMKYNV